ncbi:hypothetical protein DIPPA_00418 [Diplonema papillatum]|nr:hypothetical protein DIPPA_00418 [Diplonema papillatum]
MSRIRSICSSTAPFQIRLPSLDKETRPYGSSLLFSCPHSEDGTSPHPGLVRLHAELCGAVDFLQPRLNVFHFRLGSVARMEEAHTFARETHRWVPLSFDVSCLSVVTRPGPNQPFEVAEEIFLARVA